MWLYRDNHICISVLPGTDQGDTFQMEMSQVGFSAYYSQKKVCEFNYLMMQIDVHMYTRVGEKRNKNTMSNFKNSSQAGKYQIVLLIFLLECVLISIVVL